MILNYPSIEEQLNIIIKNKELITKEYLCINCKKEVISFKGRKYCKECSKIINEERNKFNGSHQHEYRKTDKYKNKQKRYYSSYKGKNTLKRLSKKRKSIVNNFTKEEWENKLKLTNGICPMCKIYVGIDKLCLEHIIPISKVKEGHVYNIEDVQPLCKPCNSKKSNIIDIKYNFNKLLELNKRHPPLLLT